MTTTAPDPLVEAIVRLLTRHHNGCDHPVQPAPWMRTAATEIAECLHHISFALSPWDEVLMEGPFIDLCELAPELDRRADA